MDLKAGAQESINGVYNDLVDLSHRIHANPELGFEEEKASAWLAEYLSDAGFEVETGICDLPTALLGAGWQRPSARRHLRRVRLPSGYRPCLRTQHHCGHGSRGRNCRRQVSR